MLLTSAYIWIQNGWRKSDATLGNFHKDVPDYSLNRRFRYSTRFHTFWYDYGYNLQTAKDILHVTVPHHTRTNYKCYKLQILIKYHTYGVNRLSDKSTPLRLPEVTNVFERSRVASPPITTSADKVVTIYLTFVKKKTSQKRKTPH